MKKFFPIVLFSFLPLICQSQVMRQVDPEKAALIIASIEKSSKTIDSFECDFSEEKILAVLREPVHSEGKMYYIRNDRLRWEYFAPTPLVFIVNKDKTAFRNNGKTEKGNTGANAAFRNIGKIIIRCIAGEGLINEKIFTSTCSSDGNLFRITLVPKEKQMKSVISSLSFLFSLRDFGIVSIELAQEEDKTLIILKNKMVNKVIDPKLFEI